MSANNYIFVSPETMYGTRMYESKAALVRAIRGIVYHGASAAEKARSFSPPPKSVGRITNTFLLDAYMRLCPERMKRKANGQQVVFHVVAEPVTGGYNVDGTAIRGLRLMREDGTHEAITFAVDKIADKINWAQELNSTLRHIVNFYIQKERERLAAQTEYCPISGERVTPETPMHVDHVAPLFHEIVTGWLNENGITPGPELFEPKTGETPFRVLSSETLTDSFIKYHAWESTLMLVSAKANLEKGAKKIAE